MPRIRVNDVEIDYELRGDAGARPLVLLRGLGTQRIQWPEAFLEPLVAAGHRLALPDNRDVGLSTHFREAGAPDLGAVLAALREGRAPQLPYTLADMADDVAGLIDAVAGGSAHVLGVSMGGRIAQLLALRRPERVRSLVSVMSSTGSPELPGPTEAARKVLFTPAPRERAAWIEHQVQLGRVLGSPAHPTPDDERRALAARVYDRAFDPEGMLRQLAALQAQGDLRPALRGIRVPTLVIHGLDDPLVSPVAGRDTAAAIPGAELLEIPGMGHEIPAGLAGTLAAAISEHTAGAEPGAS